MMEKSRHVLESFRSLSFWAIDETPSALLTLFESKKSVYQEERFVPRLARLDLRLFDQDGTLKKFWSTLLRMQEQLCGP